MQTVTTIDLDIAKSVFQVRGLDAAGQVVVRRQLKLRYVLTFFQKLSPCLVGIQACGPAHNWSRRQVLTIAAAVSVTGAAIIGASTPARAAKVSQKIVKYQDTPKGELHCDNCALFEAPSSCKTVDGRSPRRAGVRYMPKSRVTIHGPGPMRRNRNVGSRPLPNNIDRFQAGSRLNVRQNGASGGSKAPT